MGRRGQLGVFLAASVFVVLVFGFLAFIFSYEGNSLDDGLAQEGLAVSRLVASCLDKELVRASALGFSDGVRSKQEAQIEAGLKECSDFSSFLEKGVVVEAGEPDAVVSVDSSLVVSVDFPLSLRKDGSAMSIRSFSSKLDREVSFPIPRDPSGLVSDTVFLSSDGRAELVLKKGSFFSVGSVVDELSVRLIDSSLENKGDEVPVSIAYEFSPDAAGVSAGKAELSIAYDESSLSVPKSALNIAYYDAGSKLWRVLPGRVDESSNRVFADVDKIGTFAVVYSAVGEKFVESKSVYSGLKRVSSPVVDVDDPYCFSGILDVFPVKGDPWFMNDWGFARVQGSHEGTDIFESEGREVVAAASGIIHDRYCNSLGGNAIEIAADDGVVYYYAHMSRFGNYRIGDRVNAGDVIGYVGTTIGCGRCVADECGIPGQTVPHLHFGVYVNWKAQNPYCALLRAKK